MTTNNKTDVSAVTEFTETTKETTGKTALRLREVKSLNLINFTFSSLSKEMKKEFLSLDTKKEKIIFIDKVVEAALPDAASFYSHYEIINDDVLVFAFWSPCFNILELGIERLFKRMIDACMKPIHLL